MKVAVVLACLVALVASAPSNRGLKDDLGEFVALLPVDDLLSLALKYFASDKEVQAVFQYLQSKEFCTVWEQFFALPEVNNLLKYLEEAGVPAFDTLNQLADLLGLPHVEPKTVRGLRTGGLNGLLEEALALLPTAELKALFEEKLKTSPEFKALFEKLQHADFHQLVDLYNNSKEVQSLVQKLREHGVDVDKIVEIVKGFFGWGSI